jgi:hypothetical protein
MQTSENSITADKLMEVHLPGEVIEAMVLTDIESAAEAVLAEFAAPECEVEHPRLVELCREIKALELVVARAGGKEAASDVQP